MTTPEADEQAGLAPHAGAPDPQPPPPAVSSPPPPDTPSAESEPSPFPDAADIQELPLPTEANQSTTLIPTEAPHPVASTEREVIYVPLAVTIGDGFKFGCGFFLAMVVALLVGFVLLAALFVITGLFGLNLPIGR